MLATLTDEPFSRRGWIFEPKLDGERCLALGRGGKVRLYSRNEKPLEATYPELIEPLRAQRPDSFIADGEVVAFEGGVTSFARLQKRMQIRDPRQALASGVPVFFYLFDLLYLEGHDTREAPLCWRKQLLRSSFEFADPLRLTSHRETDGEIYYLEACRQRWEGLIAKNAASAYVSRRSRDWLKVKCVNRQEFVVAGYTDPQGSRTGLGALLVGYYEDGKLRCAGKVGTGYDTETLRRLVRLLQPLERNSPPCSTAALPRKGVHWVEPRLVADVAFTEWTADGKLRHPRFVGLRDDKPPRDVKRER